ncbi:MAG: hypothetical protein KatS3mg027_1673 [Bacteroidia bacterium]|nr:MAG: hypothetical protein KatS3mg027_1673 [Bacteroidia bacterium]
MEILFWILCIVVNASTYSQNNCKEIQVVDEHQIIKGNEQIHEYLPLIQNKKVAVVANACSYIKNKHLIDTLLSHNIHITKIFAPEHGFRTTADAGVKVSDSIDLKTGIPIISLYGKKKAPSAKDLENIDVILFDLQDVGVRFYTYISTLYYILKSCAENKIPLIVLDRPNPNGFYVDGPVLDTNYKSFVGVIPIPIVYGMTIGELARMMNNEPKFRPSSQKADLTIIKLKNYSHNMMIKMQSVPSPNLNSWQSIILYPSLGLFEGTIISVGRGTEKPFQVIGHPDYPDKSFCFTPKSNAISKNPKYKDKVCCGLDLSNDTYLFQHPQKINLKWIIQFYKLLKNKKFFDKNFNYHAGNSELQKDITAGLSEDKIRKKWEKELQEFQNIRKKYLLYE